MDKEFEIIDHTADVGIIAYGADMRQTFANAAKALFSIITELEDVEETLHRDIEVTATDQESLLVAWLNELIYLFDVDNIVLKRFDILQQLVCRVQLPNLSGGLNHYLEKFQGPLVLRKKDQPRN